MGKSDEHKNDTHHVELYKEIMDAEMDYNDGADKEKRVVKAMAPKIMKAAGLGWFVGKLCSPVLHLCLRIAVRSVIYVLNDMVGRNWLDQIRKQVKKH